MKNAGLVLCFCITKYLMNTVFLINSSKAAVVSFANCTVHSRIIVNSISCFMLD